MALNTYASLTNEQRSFYEAALISRTLPNLPALGDGQKGVVPRHNGMAVEWRKFAAFALATTALTEGTPPTENDLTITKVTATLAQYGAWSKHSDLLIVAGIDPVLTEIVGLHGEQAGQSLHSLLMTVVGGGTSVRWASTATSRITVAAGMNATLSDVRKAVRDLRVNNVQPYSDGYYHAIVHPAQEHDLISNTAAGEWIDLHKYTDNLPMLKGEFGRAHGVRFMRSTQAPKFAAGGASGIDVYGMVIYGPGFWGQRDLATQTTGGVDPRTNKGAASVKVIPADRDDKQDPLGQYGVVGWKFATVFKRLDETKGIRLETAASA